MDKEIFRKLTFKKEERYEMGTTVSERRSIVLTKEVNRLILWEEITRYEDTDVIVLKTFGKWERDTAIETAVVTALQAIEDAVELELKDALKLAKVVEACSVADDIEAERRAVEAQRDHDEGELDPERHQRHQRDIDEAREEEESAPRVPR